MQRQDDQIRSTHTSEGAIVLDIRHGQIFRLNVVGSKILELLKSQLTMPAIAGRISTEFSVDREIAEADVREFMEVLHRHQLIETQQTGDYITGGHDAAR